MKIKATIRLEDINDFSQFQQFLKANKDFPEDWQESGELDKSIFQELLKHYAKDLGEFQKRNVKEYNKWDIEYPLAPIRLRIYHILFPSDYFKYCGIDVCLDAYFGICYQPERTSMYSGEVEDILEDRISRTFLDVNKILDHVCHGSGLESMLTVKSLENIYGTNEVKEWWRNLDEDELEFLQHQNSGLVRKLVVKYGGGLNS